MNLPMVIEAYASRFSMNTAREIATHIVETAKEGIKTLPEELMPQEEATPQAAAQPAAPQGAIPEGTVIGDGKIKYVLARIDTRLLHGQVATGWTKATNPNRIIVVSDNVAKGQAAQEHDRAGRSVRGTRQHGADQEDDRSGQGSPLWEYQGHVAV